MVSVLFTMGKFNVATAKTLIKVTLFRSRMSLLNRDRKLFYLAGVALLGGRIVIRGNFGHVKVAPTIL